MQFQFANQTDLFLENNDTAAHKRYFYSSLTVRANWKSQLINNGTSFPLWNVAVSLPIPD